MQTLAGVLRARGPECSRGPVLLSEAGGLVDRRIEAAQGPAQPGSSLQKWADWATIHADRLDPLVKAPPSILDEKPKWEHSY
jgi:hypothetical protein